MFLHAFLLPLVMGVSEALNVHLAAKNPLMPEGWASMKAFPHNIAKKKRSSSEPVFLMTAINTDSKCGGSTKLIMGTGFNLCMQGVNANGQSVGSAINYFVAQDDCFIHFNTQTFNASNCSGPMIESTNTIPTKCIAADDGSGVMYGLSASVTPWIEDQWSSGIVTE